MSIRPTIDLRIFRAHLESARHSVGHAMALAAQGYTIAVEQELLQAIAALNTARRMFDDKGLPMSNGNAAAKREIGKLHSVIQATVSRSDAEIDRLRREAAELRKQIGNAAKLREALKSLMDNLQIHAMMPCELITMNHAEVCAMIEDCRAALAKPPRNCDILLVVAGPANNNADKAWTVFKNHNPDAYFDVPGLLRCMDWLFAPATERKGGPNGSK